MFINFLSVLVLSIYRGKYKHTFYTQQAYNKVRNMTKQLVNPETDFKKRKSKNFSSKSLEVSIWETLHKGLLFIGIEHHGILGSENLDSHSHMYMVVEIVGI